MGMGWGWKTRSDVCGGDGYATEFWSQVSVGGGAPASPWLDKAFEFGGLEGAVRLLHWKGWTPGHGVSDTCLGPENKAHKSSESAPNTCGAPGKEAETQPLSSAGAQPAGGAQAGGLRATPLSGFPLKGSLAPR